ncbi:HAMP domain-containing sensor histidine kinase [Metabacillus indicus]|uniref:sensor histidine kinase n=1 Tax=Metabacillus indicus TaxID=246786 RepID=UPI002A047100|nr:HAMP domain-containing sensor histidine kinase [Metabacillus indicus]MDX8288737.1 HAMP domain-containing sensor histidine kinase [Metabacillus indicus]
MKNKSLAFQIWIVISGILLLISLVLMIIFPTTLRNFFTNEIYNTIENEQHILTEYRLQGDMDMDPLNPNGEKLSPDRSVQHIILPENAPFFYNEKKLPLRFLQETQSLAANQEAITEEYSRVIDDERLFFVIKKVSLDGQPAFLLSYAWDSYRNDLVLTLFKQLVLVMIIVFLFSWIPSIWLAKYLSRPLVSLEKDVKRISNEDWHEPVILERSDEIGKLGSSIEQMRQRLVKKDEAQRALLQNISHDLKTPVMVIRGYAKSVNDGIYPKGDLTSTMDVIEEESERLEKKIKDLLYITKLDYLSSRNATKEKLHLNRIVQEVIERIRWSRQALDYSIQLEEAVIHGDPELWMKLLENLFENQLRYADTIIGAKLTREGSDYLLKIWNDGPPIEEDILAHLFEPFHKGSNGEFGLGLNIVKRIAELHGGKVWAVNEQGLSTFYVKIPV